MSPLPPVNLNRIQFTPGTPSSSIISRPTVTPGVTTPSTTSGTVNPASIEQYLGIPTADPSNNNNRTNPEGDINGKQLLINGTPYDPSKITNLSTNFEASLPGVKFNSSTGQFTVTQPGATGRTTSVQNANGSTTTTAYLEDNNSSYWVKGQDGKYLVLDAAPDEKGELVVNTQGSPYYGQKLNDIDHTASGRPMDLGERYDQSGKFIDNKGTFTPDAEISYTTIPGSTTPGKETPGLKIVNVEETPQGYDETATRLRPGELFNKKKTDYKANAPERLETRQSFNSEGNEDITTTPEPKTPPFSRIKPKDGDVPPPEWNIRQNR